MILGDSAGKTGEQGTAQSIFRTAQGSDGAWGKTASFGYAESIVCLRGKSLYVWFWREGSLKSAFPLLYRIRRYSTMTEISERGMDFLSKITIL